MPIDPARAPRAALLQRFGMPAAVVALVVLGLYLVRPGVVGNGARSPGCGWRSPGSC